MTMTPVMALNSCQLNRQARAQETSGVMPGLLVEAGARGFCQNRKPNVIGKYCALAFVVPPDGFFTSGPQT